MQQAIDDNLVVTLGYRDRHGEEADREVAPVGVMAVDDDWYVVGWCRLRDDARTFRLDRIRRAALTGEAAPERSPERFLEFTPWLLDRPHPLG